MAWLDQLCADEGAAPGPALVVCAHPDDETIGAGSRLPRLRHATFVYVTDGAPPDGIDAARQGLTLDAYRQARRHERDAVLALCGIGPPQVLELGCPDQAAARRLPELAMRMADLIDSKLPLAVLTHPYEGGHPDHDATAFAVHAAAALLRRRGKPAPELLEMTSYHLGAAGLRSGEFLPDADADRGLRTVHLDDAARQRKRALMDRYRTQRDTLGYFQLEVERFRPAPRYDFLRPPHAGPLFYERMGWGFTGESFRAACADAMAQLGLEGE